MTITDAVLTIYALTLPFMTAGYIYAARREQRRNPNYRPFPIVSMLAIMLWPISIPLGYLASRFRDTSDES